MGRRMASSIGTGSDEGGEALRDRVFEVAPTVQAFGHIHEGSGIDRPGKTLFVNAAILDERYRVANACRVVDLVRSDDGSLKAAYVGRLNRRDGMRSLERAGYSVARIRRGDMISVEIDKRLIWLDTGFTVRVVGDSLDPEGVFFQEVNYFLDVSH